MLGFWGLKHQAPGNPRSGATGVSSSGALHSFPVTSFAIMGTLQRQSTLSKQASAMFQMTLDQYQQSMGSGKPFGSLNMVRS